MHPYMHIYTFYTLCLFYFFAAVAQNHFPQLGISRAARAGSLPAATRASSFVARFCCRARSSVQPHCIGQIETLASAALRAAAKSLAVRGSAAPVLPLPAALVQSTHS